MRFLNDPRTLFLTHLLPLGLLLLYGYRQYTLVASLLSTGNLSQWSTLLMAVVTMMAIVGGMATLAITTRERLGLAGHLFLLILQAGLLIIGLANVDALYDWTVPRWLRADNAMLYFLTAVMPGLVAPLVGLVVAATPDLEQHEAWKDFLVVLLIPVGIYCFGMLLVPLFAFGGAYFFLIVGISLSLIFFFFVLRWLYVVGAKRDLFREQSSVGLLLVGVLFPVLGLLLNNGELTDGIGGGNGGMFGDFSHLLFFVVAVANGLLLILPASGGRLYRLFLFLARAVGFAYVTYFFLVFLPYVPLALPAMFFFGAGLLLLTPLLLFGAQWRVMRRDYQHLRTYFPASFLLPVAVLAFLTFPLVLSVNYAFDAAALDRALAYVYEPNRTEEVDIPEHRLRRVLNNVDQQRSRSSGWNFGNSQTPYLTGYYRWLVLDNLTLSDAKLNTLRAVFFGDVPPETETRSRTGNAVDRVQLTGIASRTTYDATTGNYRTWVDLQLTNQRGNRSEYATTFHLPPGVFVTDYYLDIEGRREPGILAERRAATWIYNNIVSTNRDPGFLRYAAPDRLALNVFPFTTKQTRTTGIEFLHRAPLTLTIDGQPVQLGDPTRGDDGGSLTDAANGFCFVGVGSIGSASSSNKGARPQATRELVPIQSVMPAKAAWEIIIDASRQNVNGEDALVHNVRSLVKRQGLAPDRVTVTLAGTYPRSLPYTADWPAALAKTDPGGYFAQRAVERIVRRYALDPKPYDPRLILVASNGTPAAWTDGLATLAAADPRFTDLYVLRSDGTLLRHPFADNPTAVTGKPVDRIPPPRSLRQVYQDGSTARYVLADSPGSYLLPLALEDETVPSATQDPWTAAATLYATHLRNALTGKTGTTDWLAEVRGSFKHGVLLPTTAFLALENDAQKEALRRKQTQVLAANAHLDVGNEQIRRMSEPWWVWLLGLGMFLVFGLRMRPS